MQKQDVYKLIYSLFRLKFAEATGRRFDPDQDEIKDEDAFFMIQKILTDELN